ncbi:prim-pol domain-containing protein [Schizopora paradoxa]|uniref:DNA primase n=1 Tax=Schizopora paradoxa TaxID=27342 RepID=A0A0H2SCB4_9AGAM|nr:prim-pol domain-containing protein [Schizopora paradoxa]
MDVDRDVFYDASDASTMMQFYKRLFPYKSIYTWLNHQHAPQKLFTHREFAFNLPGDVIIRYISFNTMEDMKKEVIRMNPTRFEIGPICTIRPKDRKTRPGALKPLQRELVFDIDMTDYDEIRTCCSGKGICRRCWGFIAAAVKVMDNVLRSNFGYKHILWVYSGRRGIHCWISDEEAMGLTDEQRKSVLGWLEVIKGGKDMTKKVNVRFAGGPLHPSLSNAVESLRGTFPKLILDDQKCFDSKEQTDTLLDLLGDKDIALKLRKRWLKRPRSSSEKWSDIKDEVVSQAQELGKKPADAPLYKAVEDIVLQYTYPRMDSEVSKHRNHLLKSPFCVHPGTGRVCVPVDPENVENFDPERVPTVDQLLKELDAVGTKDVAMSEDGTPQHAGSDWEKTSLKPYVDILDAHVRGLMEISRLKRRQNGGDASLEY